MKRTSIVAILLILCLLMNLAACDSQSADPTVPSQNTATSPTTAEDPTDPAETEPSTPPAIVAYQAAREAARQLENYILTFSYDLTYQVVNTGTIVLPLTGATDNSLVLVSAGCVAMVLIAVIAVEKRKRGMI